MDVRKILALVAALMLAVVGMVALTSDSPSADAPAPDTTLWNPITAAKNGMQKLSGKLASGVGMCPLPCPFASSFSAHVTMTRKSVNSDDSVNDYTAVGEVGITHEIMHGSIVYAVDMQVTYQATGQTVRKWLAGWNYMGSCVRRYFVVEPVDGTGGTCHVEQDDDFSGGDPFTSILKRFTPVATSGGSGSSSQWNYVNTWAGGGKHVATCTTGPAGTPIQNSVIRTFKDGAPVSVIRTSYSSIGKSPRESIFWPRNKYKDCDDHHVANFTTVGTDSVCAGDMLALEYGCM